MGLEEGISQHPTLVELCNSNPSVGERVLGSVHHLATLPYFVGFLVLVRQIIRRARREGLFTAAVATGVTRLGWFILLGLVAVCLAEGVTSELLLRRWVEGGGAFVVSSWSWAALLGGFATLSVGRIMARAVPMQDELDTTV